MNPACSIRVYVLTLYPWAHSSPPIWNVNLDRRYRAGNWSGKDEVSEPEVSHGSAGKPCHLPTYEPKT